MPAFYQSMGHVPGVGYCPALSEQKNRHDFAMVFFFGMKHQNVTFVLLIYVVISGSWSRKTEPLA